MWGVPALLFLVACFHRMAPGVIAKDLMQAFHAGGAIVGLLSATYFYAYAALLIPAGLLLDTFGARRVVAAGGAVMGLGTLAMGVAASSPALFAGRFVVGLGAAVTFVGALKLAATWFPPAQFATLAAVTATVGIVGTLVGTVPLAWLAAWVGWRGALGAVGLVTLGLAALCAVVVRDRPAAAGAAPPGEAMTFVQVVRGTGQVLANPHTWPPFVAFFFLYAAIGNLMLWIVPYLRDVYRLDTTTAAFYAMATSLALLVAGPLTGLLSDRVLRRRKLPYTVLVGLQLACWLVFIATLGAVSLRAVYVLLFLLGAVGSAFVLTWPIGREVNPPHLAGVAVAVANLGGFVGAAVTQGPLGALLDARWTGTLAAGARVYPLEAYRAVFAVCALFVLAAMLTSLLMRETRGRNISHELRGVGRRAVAADR